MNYYNVYIENLQGFYTYSSEKQIKIGSRVLVSFCKRNRVGLIVEKESKTQFDFKILEIKEILYNDIMLSEKFIKLLLWISKYYLNTFNQVYTASLPSNIKIKYDDIYILNENKLEIVDNEIVKWFQQKSRVRKQTLIKLFTKLKVEECLQQGYLKNIDGWFSLTDKTEGMDSSLLNYFNEKKEIKKDRVEKIFSKKDIEKLIVNGDIIHIKKIQNFNEDRFKQSIIENKMSEDRKLNNAQQRIKDGIEKSTRRHFLIRGVTGSGKTEIYIKLIKEAYILGKGSIFLVPEISLTPQMIKRFKDEFGESVAVLHSKMTDSMRAKEWYSIYKGDKRIVLGVRSAIFAPVRDLKYIIVDEEHETSYKQDTKPIYNAKYVAIKKAELENAKVIFGSATPSIESYYYAKTDIFELYEIDYRYKGAMLPEIEIVDMKSESDSFFSEKLLEEIREKLIKKEQIILLLNRKGYSTVVQCYDCGYVEECEHCSIKLNYSSSRRTLKCNYCGVTKKFQGYCTKCGSKNISFGGRGVERIEEEIKKRFDVNIIRVDGDVSQDRNFYEKMYNDFYDKKYDIMIGTQIISRGFHFPNVTLVGVVNADTLLGIPDFRIGEKTYQLTTQVAGRAGRGEKKGKVIIQTYQPENYVIKMIKESDYVKFYEKEIELRQILSYPPFSKTIAIWVSSTEESGLLDYCNIILEQIKEENIQILGPVQSIIYKIKGRYRYHFFIMGNRKNINIFKESLMLKLKKIENKKFRVIVDIDPINLL